MSKRFGARLKAIRLESGLSQREIAPELGIDHSTLSLYESAKSEPTESVIVKLSEVFEVSADYILGLIPFESETPKKMK